MMTIKHWAAIALIAIVASCNSDEQNGTTAHQVQLVAVYPQAGSVNVDVGTKVTMTFSHPMMQGMEQYLLVYEGNEQGPLVNGQWSWENGYKSLVFSPAAPLKSHTTYLVHLKSGMMGADGQLLGGTMMQGGHMMNGSEMGEMSYTFTTT